MTEYSTVTYDIKINSESKGVYLLLANGDNGVRVNLKKDNVRVFVGDFRSGGDVFNGGTVDFLYKYKTLHGSGSCDNGLWKAVLEKAAGIVKKAGCASKNDFYVEQGGTTLRIAKNKADRVTISLSDKSGNILTHKLSNQNLAILTKHLRTFRERAKGNSLVVI
jgi:hypothetical protein